MIEWLSGDSLNGIGTTIGFFIFLILGHHIRLWRTRKGLLKNR